MITKHTPGPWIANGPTICAAPTDAAPIGYGLAHILNPYAGAVGAADRVEANARLIASAPALLAVLEHIVARATRPVPDSTGQEMVSIRKALLDEARAAIAAATGQGV